MSLKRFLSNLIRPAEPGKRKVAPPKTADESAKEYERAIEAAKSRRAAGCGI